MYEKITNSLAILVVLVAILFVSVLLKQVDVAYKEGYIDGRIDGREEGLVQSCFNSDVDTFLEK